MHTHNGSAEASNSQYRLEIDRHLRALGCALAGVDPPDMTAVRTLLRGVATDTSLAPGVTAAPARNGPVPGTWLIPKDADPDRRMVYFHGLSFMAGDLATYGGFVSRLAAAANACTLLVDYRLAPEHHYPAAHDDCLAAMLWAREHGPDGAASARCAVAGDSCGASLVLATAVAAQGIRKPAAALVLFSPFVDLAVSGESWIRNDGRDPLLNADVARGCASLYAPDVDPRDCRLSPLFGDLEHLPPIQIHASMSDPAFDDAARLIEASDRAGVPTESHSWSDLPHSWFLFHNELAEARFSIELAGSFVRRM
ncbi:MAG TPA: alpha/beta hydrolase [Opitutaceae bacterium]|nr:alpha/beta hydrolase [Opitutaceae bacterium]